MNDIRLSYLITTKDKLPYLKPSIKKLMEQKGADEEILVADAASADGTKEFLESLKESGGIDYFVSEPDTGETHGLNKLLMSARGTLVTVITDDDVFYYPAIQAIKDFMLAHPFVDVMSANGGFKNQDVKAPVRPLVYEDDYKKWILDRTPFSFCGLGIFLRKSSLPILGLWNTSFRRADAEFALRATSGKANMAWYTGYSYVNVSNPQSVSLVYMKKIKDETDRLNKFYLNKNPESFVAEKLRILKNRLKSGALFRKKNGSAYQAEWPALVSVSEAWLEKMNGEKKPEFLWNKNYGV